MEKTTLLITTYNRGDLLGRTLEKLSILTRPDEVLVIDDGGDDNTRDICQRAVGSYGLNLRYVYHNNPGRTLCAQARNVGLKLAENDWIITSEPELIFDSDVVPDLHAQRSTYPCDVISAGRIRFLDGQHKVEQVVEGWVAPFCALYHRDWLMDIGGWDESFPGPWGWDDTDLLTRLRITGIGQYIAKNVQCTHQWHPKGGDAGRQNERHFMAKSFHQDWDDPTDVIANRGREWGVLKT